MKKLTTIRFLILILSVSSSLSAFAQDSTDTRYFEPPAMQQDFNYLRKTLEDTHPGLYMHHSKKEMQHIMDSLYALLDKPMSFLSFYRIIAYLVAEVKCEHSYTAPYRTGYNNRILRWKMIPFQLYFSGDRSYVTVNRSADSSIHLGDEVVSINHYPIDSIKREIYKYLPADGNIESGKEHTVSSVAFNTAYYQFIERPDTFVMTFRNPAGQLLTRSFDRDLSIQDNNTITAANPANADIFALDKKNKALQKTPLRLETFREKNMAVLTIRAFDGDRKKMFDFYEASFASLKKDSIASLVIDLSNNGGGDEEFACELLSYFITQPTRFINHEYLVTADSAYLALSNFPKEVINNKYAFIDSVREGKYFAKERTKYSMELTSFEPKQNRFAGKVYMYVTGATASAASTCAANAKSHGLATIVGNETAGSFSGGGTANGLDILLPNSKIYAHTSLVYCSFNTSGGDAHRGVIPDHYFIPSFTELVTGNTSWRDYIDKLIAGH